MHRLTGSFSVQLFSEVTIKLLEISKEKFKLKISTTNLETDLFYLR